MKKIAEFLFSPYLMGSLIILFAVSIAVATFIENDYGSAAARASVYNAKWFELLLIILTINVTGMVIKLKLYKRKKLSIFIFHVAFLVILLGSALTRYVGFEGIMHIREGSQSNQILSQNIYFKVRTSGDAEKDFYAMDTRLSGYSDKKFSKSVSLNGHKYKFVLEEIISNAMEAAIPDPGGEPIIQLIAFGKEFQENFLLRNGETKIIHGAKFSFNNETASDGIQVFLEDTLLSIRFPMNATTSSMMDGGGEMLEKDINHPLQKRKIYMAEGIQLVLNDMFDKAVAKWVPTPQESHTSGKDIFIFNVTGNGESQKVAIEGRVNQPGKETAVEIESETLNLSYGKLLIDLPFSIRLEDFQLERYPGSNSPSSFASEVTLIDQEKSIEEPFKIYMNNILKHKGFRFYQSFYDPDEQGTVLSVNHDFLGTFITYIGYFLLILGICWSILNKNSRFKYLARKTAVASVKRTGVIVGILLGSMFITPQSFAQIPAGLEPDDEIISSRHSKEFGEILVQDHNGRIKPVNTLASDIMRKVTKKEKYMGYHPTQLFLGMATNPGYWQTVPMIKVNNSNLATAMGINDKYGSLMDFVDMTKRGEYKLSAYVEEAYSKTPGTRNKFDKEVIAVDERVNICYMIFTGSILDIFPAAGDVNNTWYSPEEAYLHVPPTDSLFVKNITQLYFESIQESMKSGTWEKTEEYLEAILTYQYRNAEMDLPSRSKVKMEAFYNNFNVFRKLFPFYSSLGITLLLLLIMKILIPRFNIRHLTNIIIIHLAVGFAAHTLVLGLRWYISGHAPWSNGFESVVYVAWATMLAGFIFGHKYPLVPWLQHLAFVNILVCSSFKLDESGNYSPCPCTKIILVNDSCGNYYCKLWFPRV